MREKTIARVVPKVEGHVYMATVCDDGSIDWILHNISALAVGMRNLR